MTTYPPGLITVRFCVVTQELSNTQLATFVGARGLPSGVAYEPYEVAVIYKPPSGSVEVLPRRAIEQDAMGLWHAQLNALTEGEWQWEGHALNNAGELLQSTGLRPFSISAALRVP